MNLDSYQLWGGAQPGLAPLWQPAKQWIGPPEAQAWAPWLREPGSLTQRLREHRPPVQVQPVFEGLQTPHPAEQALLHIPAAPATPSAWVREVQLLGAGQPRLWARTVIPHWSAHNPWAQVQTLGQQPLGELLFVWPDIVRGPLHVAHTPMGWARYCVYHRHQAPLLLAEVFLPALLLP
jgi:chorismate--pyruvate lyase